ncbi:MAG: permease prefix domain 1-containing protein [Ignavibacteria bacterium]|nr:permease prefix domain 1-containing protein [Ignavibacteria bacterium]
MITKIRQYITRAFEDVPKTKKSVEMQEELISNLNEKYNDQLAQGKSEEEAYNTVIAGIGDLSELTESLKERHVLSSISPEERRRTARNTAIAVMLFILSPMAIIIGAEVFRQEILGLASMFMLIALGTGLLIYTQASKPKYLKEEETMIEEFKEWKSKKNRNKGLFEALSSAYWLVVVALYLYISFTYFNWHYSWIIFLIASALFNILKAIVDMGQRNDQ